MLQRQSWENREHSLMSSLVLLSFLLSHVPCKAANLVLKLHFRRFVLLFCNEVAFSFVALFYLLKFYLCSSSRIVHFLLSSSVPSSEAILVVASSSFSHVEYFEGKKLKYDIFKPEIHTHILYCTGSVQVRCESAPVRCKSAPVWCMWSENYTKISSAAYQCTLTSTQCFFKMAVLDSAFST